MVVTFAYQLLLQIANFLFFVSDKLFQIRNLAGLIANFLLMLIFPGLGLWVGIEHVRSLIAVDNSNVIHAKGIFVRPRSRPGWVSFICFIGPETKTLTGEP